MKVVDFKGKEHNFPPTGHLPDLDDGRKRSELHLHARSMLRQMYPTQRVLEEVPLPGTQQYADFYLPHRKAVVEVHGRQHYEFVAHFHEDRWGFAKSKQNDAKKEEWCNINNIKYIVLPYNKIGDWDDIISES
tara:strand:- start:7321 stop:7719 length:399 start_codon:yes stop_codon:yes gene_type:complete